MSTNVGPEHADNRAAANVHTGDFDEQILRDIAAQFSDVSSLAELLCKYDIDDIYAARDAVSNTPNDQNQDH